MKLGYFIISILCVVVFSFIPASDGSVIEDDYLYPFIENSSEEAPTTEYPDDGNEPGEVVPNPDQTGLNDKGEACLLANIRLDLTVEYRTSTGVDKTKFSIPPEAGTEAACAEQPLSTPNGDIDGPAVIFTWDWSTFTGVGGPNFVIVHIKDDGETTSITDITGQVRTDSENFPNSVGVMSKLAIPVTTIYMPSGTSLTCAHGNGFVPNAEDQKGQRVDFTELGLEVGTNLEGNSFGEGRTCGAAGLKIAILTILLGVFSNIFVILF